MFEKKLNTAEKCVNTQKSSVNVISFQNFHSNEFLFQRPWFAQCFAKFPAIGKDTSNGKRHIYELRNRGYNVDVGVVPVNGKNAQGISCRTQLEVDFVCNKSNRRIYIQSALSLPTQEKIDQETNSLKRIDDGFQRVIIVGDHTISSHDENGILFINIYNFLLELDCI